MIFTDKFVYVHEPKTGGTFVTTMLFRLYGMKWTKFTHLKNIVLGEIRSRHPKYGELVHNTKKHAGCSEIPVRHRGKKVLATIRNPYDLYVSQFEFGWWKRPEFLPYLKSVPNFEKDYPDFPNISFADYVRLSDAAFERPEGSLWGLRTREFINFYFREPAEVCKRLERDPHYVATRAYRDDMFDLHFIRTDNLNRGLYDFLIGEGYEHADIEFILGQGKVLPQGKGRSAEQQWQKYYTPELRHYVREREQLLFTMFPEFEV